MSADARATWLGGHLTGNLKLVNSSSSALLTTQISLTGADLARALSPAGKPAPATGRLDVSGSFEGSGKSSRALVNALTGSGAISLSDLAMKGIRTNGLPEIVKAVDRDKDFKISAASVAGLARKAVEGGELRPGDLSIPFGVTGGKLRVSDVDMSDADASVTGEATVDLAQQTLDASLVMAFRPGEDAISGGGTPAVTLRYAGPLAHPRQTIDATELSNYLSLRSYEIQRRKVELLQAGVLEKQRLRRDIDLQRFKAAERRRDKADHDGGTAAARGRTCRGARRRGSRGPAQGGRRGSPSEGAGRSRGPKPEECAPAPTAGPAPSAPAGPTGTPPPAGGQQSGTGAPAPSKQPAPPEGLPDLKFNLPGVSSPLN